MFTLNGWRSPIAMSPFFSEHNSVYFANEQNPTADHNGAYCKDVRFTKIYNSAPNVFVSAKYSISSGNQGHVHSGIVAWVEYINKTGFLVCLKELYETKYDPLSISYTVLSDICRHGWNYFNGYCYFTSRACGSWLTAESNCSSMNSDLVTLHSQRENVYIQHLHNGDESWIGLNDRNVEGTFVWASRENSTFRYWAPNQPNDWNDEDCVHTLGAKQEYTWNDVPCNACFKFTCFTDLNECSTHTYTCGVNEDCVNTAGSYSCRCKAGYSKDGQTCSDIDECSSNSHSCDVNAVCNNTLGSYTCTCKTGYTGQGKGCSDFNECSSQNHTCGVKEDCANTVGSYSCNCKAGYSRNGQTCNDIDECASNSDSCDVNAVCKNTPGSYTCTCKTGYAGNGTTCSDINECVSGVQDCHSSASCTNTAGSYTCSCNPPSTGDGKNCTMPEECQNYQTFNSNDRKVTYPFGGSLCDSSLAPGWYRFEGRAGNRLPTKCQPLKRCKTNAVGWLKYGHPRVIDGKVSKQVCFHWNSNCCIHSVDIYVRNCGPFYVYYLKHPRCCSCRYCGI